MNPAGPSKPADKTPDQPPDESAEKLSGGEDPQRANSSQATADGKPGKSERSPEKAEAGPGDKGKDGSDEDGDEGGDGSEEAANP